MSIPVEMATRENTIRKDAYEAGQTVERARILKLLREPDDDMERSLCALACMARTEVRAFLRFAADELEKRS